MSPSQSVAYRRLESAREPHMALGAILLPYDGSEDADAMLRLACRVVGMGGRVIALYTTCVPASLPLEPLPAWFDEDGDAALNHAEAVAAAEGGAVETELTRVRRPIDALVGEANLREVDAVFLPLCSWRRPWRRLRAILSARALARQVSCPVLLGAWALPRDAHTQPSWS